MLCQEPWCFTPETIERMTDWQINSLYAEPAAKRAEQARRGETGPTPPRPSDNDIPHEPGTAEHRAMIVAGMMSGPFAMSRAAAEKSYDEQLTAYQSGK